MVIEAKVFQGITKEIIRERNIAYPHFLLPNEDEFDSQSYWFVFVCDGELMVAGRICSSLNGPIFKETGGVGYKNAENTVDLQRYFIVPKYRGILDLYEFFALCSFEFIIEKGFRYGQSSLIPGRKLQQRLERLYFEISDLLVPMKLSSGVIQSCYPVLVDFKKNKENILADKDKLWTFFEKKYTIIKSY